MGKVSELSGKNSVTENYCCNFVTIPGCTSILILLVWYHTCFRWSIIDRGSVFYVVCVLPVMCSHCVLSVFNDYNSPVSVSLWARKVCRIPWNCQVNVRAFHCMWRVVTLIASQRCEYFLSTVYRVAHKKWIHIHFIVNICSVMVYLHRSCSMVYSRWRELTLLAICNFDIKFCCDIIHGVLNMHDETLIFALLHPPVSSDLQQLSSSWDGRPWPQ